MASELHVDAIKHSGGTSALTIDSSGNVNIPGHVIQVVQDTDGSYGTVASTSYSSTPITVTITPKFSTSKVLVRAVFIFGQVRSSTNNQDHIKSFTLYRGSSNIAPHNSSFFQHQNQVGDGEGATFSEQTQVATMEFLDSPSTTSATTYTVYAKCDSSAITITINGRGNGSGLDGSTSITAMEIAQ